jgi:glycosyltransferase involved in cell wall biosynthesis
MRLAVYSDYEYLQVGGMVFAERAFAVFLAHLAPLFERFTIVGRLGPPTGKARYPLGEHVDFVALPYYSDLSQPGPVLKATFGSATRFWKSLRDVDAVWLFGPHPVALLFAFLALLRRRKVVLCVRQDLPEYVRGRRPGRPLLLASAWIMELGFRLLGRFCSVVAVGPTLTEHYQKSRRVLELTVSLIHEENIVEPESRDVSYDSELNILSVGRLDNEKNPLMLADVLAGLLEQDPRWRLIVCGEGPLQGELSRRLRSFGIQDKAELLGYVSHEEGLADLYRNCQMLLHVSWTEGLPQVLYEAFAAALPVVATDVGGVRQATGEAVSLIPAGDAESAIEALRRLSADPGLRERRLAAGQRLVEAATIDIEVERVHEFIESA